jgi:hypothetical protein
MKMQSLVAALAFLLLLVTGLEAQSGKRGDEMNTRSVQGIVTDASGKAAASAVVQLKDTKTLQIRSFYTDKDGAFHFAGLNTNVDYELKAEHNGANSGTKTLSTFDGRKTATVNLKLK